MSIKDVRTGSFRDILLVKKGKSLCKKAPKRKKQRAKENDELPSKRRKRSLQFLKSTK